MKRYLYRLFRILLLTIISGITVIKAQTSQNIFQQKSFSDFMHKAHHANSAGIVLMSNEKYEDAFNNKNYQACIYMIVGFITFSLILIVLVIMYLDKRRKTKQLVSLIQELKVHHMMVVEDEKQKVRQQLGQELHDNLAGIIAASVRILTMRGQDAPDSITKSWTSELSSLLSEGYERAHKQSYELYNDTTADTFLIILAENVELFFSGTSIEVTFEKDITGLNFSTEIKTALLLTLREGMTNIIKHSKASEVKILLYEDWGSIVLEMSDNGHGLKNKTRKGMGLNSIFDRIKQMKGKLSFDEIAGSGMCLRAEIPLTAESI